MEEPHVGDADAIAEPDDGGLRDDRHETRRPQVIDAQIDRRHARAIVFDARPYRAASGRICERGKHSSVERRTQRIPDELVAEGDLETTETLPRLGAANTE